MLFGRLAGNDWINARIYECFTAIDPRDVETFVRKFRTENDPQRFHTFRELIFGEELFRHGLKARYEQAIGGLTPDWTIYDEDGSACEIVDVVTLHPRHDIENGFARTTGSGRIWSGWITTAPDRLYRKLQDKFGAYSTFAEKERSALVVALFTEFMAPIDTSEVYHVVNELYGGLFSDYPQVSGLIHFEYRLGRYRFSGIANASAAIQSDMMKRFI